MGLTQGILLADYLKHLLRDSPDLPADLRQQALASPTSHVATNSLVRFDGSKQTIRLVVDTGAEEELVRVPSDTTVSKRKPP